MKVEVIQNSSVIDTDVSTNACPGKRNGIMREKTCGCFAFLSSAIAVETHDLT